MQQDSYDDFQRQGEFIVSESDGKLYRRILLDNGLEVLLIHEPEVSDGWHTSRRRRSTVELLNAMVESSAMQSADEDEESDDEEDDWRFRQRRKQRRRKDGSAPGGVKSGGEAAGGDEVEAGQDTEERQEAEEGEEEDDTDSDADEEEDEETAAEDEKSAERESGDRDDLAESRRRHRASVAKLSAAAICLGCGNAQDDADLPGLAHCLEHMVFMGCDKYPDENGFDAFVQECGGFSNAWTDSEQTLFHFCVRQQNFAECLDRFAHLLAEPLLRESSLEREVQAVHSEFELACTNVDAQINFFQAWLAGTGHPMGGFKSGNRLTLWERPRAAGIDLRERLKAYWRRHYTAANMRLAVQSRIDLDELEDTVRQSFACLQPSDRQAVKRQPVPPPFANCERFLGRVYKLVPAKEAELLRLAWPGPPARLRDQPHRLLAICLTHEGPGSVLDCLRRTGLAAELWAGVRRRSLSDNPDASLFEVGIRLTPAGLRAWERIVGLLFAYIGMLGQRLPELQRLYAERRRIWRTAFRFQEEEEPAENVETACLTMHRLPPEMWLLGDRMMRRFSLDAIEDYWGCLRPDNCCVLLASRSFAPDCDRTTDGLAVRYAEHQLSAESVALWARYVREPDPELLSAHRLHLPLPNRFVAECFDVLPLEGAYSQMGLSCVPEYPVRLLVGDPNVDRFGALYYYKDRKFNTPRAVVRVSLDSPVICESLENSTLLHLWLYMFNFQLNKELYAAFEAYLSYEILHVEPFSIRIRIEGFNDKLFSMYSAIVDKLRQFGDMLEAMDHRLNFGLSKEEVRKTMANMLLTPSRLISELRLYMLERDRYLRNDQLLCLESLGLADVAQFHRRLLSQLGIKVYVHGNYGPEDAKDYFRRIVSVLDRDCEVASAQTTCAALPPGRHGVRVENLKSGDVNSVLVEYFQFDYPPTMRDYVLSALLLHIMSEPCYDYLRTKHQLGYQVFCDNRQTNGAIGFMVLVASQADKFSMCSLQERVDKFIGSHFVKLLANMPDEVFANYARSLVDLVLAEDVGMTQQADRYWVEILDSCPGCPPAFDRRYREAELLLHSISKADAVDFYLRAISASDRRSFTFQIEGSTKKALNKVAAHHHGSRKIYALPLRYCNPDASSATTATSPAGSGGGIAWARNLLAFKADLKFHPARPIG